MGGAVSAGEDNNHLIDNLKEAEYIKTRDVEEVFRAVDRADYYIDGHKDTAYKDLAWKHGNIHLSAPCIYSEVMESLQLKPGMSFLNLGSGTGYLSTMAGLILGANGINHGVEIHHDVIEYANDRLHEFIQNSTHFDKFQFCEPKYVLGNCLNVIPGSRCYDRVYCGAACPQEHEKYMGNLLKVGGILVMPMEDQLQQITRTGQSTWEVKNVLPVSFAPLVLPSKADGDHLTSIDLPSVDPRNLQDLCRLCIRLILREIVNKEHPPMEREKKPKPRVNRPRIRSRITISSVNNMLELASEIMNELNENDEEEGAEQEREESDDDDDIEDNKNTKKDETKGEDGKTNDTEKNNENDETITEELAECQISKGRKRAHENGSQDENGSKKVSEEKLLKIDEQPAVNHLHAFSENIELVEEDLKDPEESVKAGNNHQKTNNFVRKDIDENMMDEEEKTHDSDSESNSSVLSSSSSSQDSFEKIRLRLSRELYPSEPKSEEKKEMSKSDEEPNYLREKIRLLPLPLPLIEYLLYYRKH
ncbi:protein-L-isoaspartate O-methyltransferase domain-containing protein 1-like [Saccoglossus kowalevskii]|uniref:Protein-L-isoaspartate O-methyltransferase domain-containing protein 1-like n=1 Tax=Saccoglossus kowalevskii TaxID=10224 RepID=A0ABM0GI69_SACKO|nr:PREDICTED: protein-L-isoaspartate O-methyltransferase domain-containing protein 1-like [Saccoglossus kowalevskii]